MRTRKCAKRAALVLAAVAGFLVAAPAPSAGQGFFNEGEGVLSCSRPGVAMVAASAASPSVTAIDVLSYDLHLRTAMTDEILDGHTVIRLRLLAPTDSVSLHGVFLTFDTVRVEGGQVAVRVDSAGERFTVPLPSVRPAGDTITIEIFYRRLPSAGRPGGRSGYYFFDTTTPGVPANLGYTVSEPSDARFWMPCHDEPSDKARSVMRITVPQGYVAASNGRLIGAVSNPDSTVTWHWREDNPITTYLMCATISHFAVSAVPYTRGSGDTLSLQYYTWPEDSASCAEYLTVVRDMMEALEGMFGTYPFDKYGMTAVTPFPFGGMEHQTITTMHRALKTDEKTVVHELAHSWWGNDVTCGTWADLWLNESFATYSEALWKESRGGMAALRNHMASLRNFNYLSWTGTIYDPGSQWPNIFVDAVYGKGGWVLHTLRGVLGDARFFKVLEIYRGKFRGGNAVTADLEAVVDSVAGEDFSWFFDRWIRGKGWPVYAFSTFWKPDTLMLTIEQRQDTSWGTFRMPLPVRLYSSVHGDSTVTVLDSLRFQTISVPLGYRPDSVRLDPDGWVLKQISGPQTDVAEDRTVPMDFQLDQNYPNPFNPTTTIRFTLPISTRVRLSVFDLLGREVAVLEDGTRPPGLTAVTFDASGLASGVYVVRLRAGGQQMSRKMVFQK